MRIAYVSLHWPRTVESGVGKKIAQQIQTWREAGHEVQFFMHMLDSAPDAPLVPAVTKTFRSSVYAWNRLGTEIDRSRAMANLLPEIRCFHPDVIYLRWSMYVYPAHRLFRIAPVVMEINTNDVVQHGLLGFPYSIYNRLTRGIFLRNVSGLVCASQELADAREFAAYRKPVCVVANGIDLKLQRQVRAPANKTPRLAFIGTPGLPWHGVDKLVYLARAFPDIVIDLIGYEKLEDGSKPPENLKLHGYLASREYEKILAGVDAGIGTLALHRKRMEEASPLKTRECLAFGIPMIIPYLDTDLQSFESPAILRLPNTEDNVRRHGHEIRDFAYSMRGVRVDPVEIKKRIDIRAKETRRLAFFRECL